ncbi:MAG TPA: hypothetical protein VD968_00925 [Pyrinomonadaceae bacterium]|nr:hypothetical protein [Pyrinomonadaceae bacterium]
MSRRGGAPGAKEKTKTTLLVAAALALLAAAPPLAHGARQREDAPRAPAYELEGTLADIKTKRKVTLVVVRAKTVDSRDTARSAIEEARSVEEAREAAGEEARAGANRRQRRRHAYAYNVVAEKLNNYMKKHGGMSAAMGLDDAEFVVIFNLLEYRRVLNSIYPFGELFVVVNGPRPRLVWRSSKATFAEDAAGEFIKELKASRGQK